MTDEYQQYNAMKKWFDRNCDITLDCPVRRRDLKNILKACFKVYLDWEDDMVVPSVPDLYSDTDVRFVRNPGEVRSCGRPKINRNKSSCQNAFREDVLELHLVSHNNGGNPNVEEQDSNIDVQSDDGNGRGNTVVEAEEVVEVEGKIAMEQHMEPKTSNAPIVDTNVMNDIMASLESSS
ncbi:hypothetical protein CQW23_19238 [Capsicum baccatum]|uniref:Uncharacterized protein n=1 Tax=Capsicum baccatum TaxID=33114 RepID=A0A2G2W595_CAPBA|nr:hypothetical protein CQW23_19238 [Capsicum baccatum]